MADITTVNPATGKDIKDYSYQSNERGLHPTLGWR